VGVVFGGSRLLVGVAFGGSRLLVGVAFGGSGQMRETTVNGF
jgi:hypothetical protein